MTGTAPRKRALAPCLEGFEHINRYWDRQQETYSAKILPGEFYVTRNDELIATTLGSCVSACIWDELSGIGGMNHFMLPLTEKQIHEVTWGNNLSDATRYGNYAMEHLVNEILKNGGIRSKLKAKVFGGGRVLKTVTDIGDKNARFVIEYLSTEKIPVLAEDLGDIYPRKILFDPRSGRARMKKIKSTHNETIMQRERAYEKSLVQAPVEGDIELF